MSLLLLLLLGGCRARRRLELSEEFLAFLGTVQLPAFQLLVQVRMMLSKKL